MSYHRNNNQTQPRANRSTNTTYASGYRSSVPSASTSAFREYGMMGFSQGTQSQVNSAIQTGGSSTGIHHPSHLPTPQASPSAHSPESTGLMGFSQPQHQNNNTHHGQYGVSPQTPPQSPLQLINDTHDFGSRILRALKPLRESINAEYEAFIFPNRVDFVFKAAKDELCNDFDKYDREYRHLMKELADWMTEKRLNFRKSDYLDLL